MFLGTRIEQHSAIVALVLSFRCGGAYVPLTSRPRAAQVPLTCCSSMLRLIAWSRTLAVRPCLTTDLPPNPLVECNPNPNHVLVELKPKLFGSRPSLFGSPRLVDLDGMLEQLRPALTFRDDLCLWGGWQSNAPQTRTQVAPHLDAVLLQLLRVADAAQHQQLRGAHGPGGENDLARNRIEARGPLSARARASGGIWADLGRSRPTSVAPSTSRGPPPIARGFERSMCVNDFGRCCCVDIRGPSEHFSGLWVPQAFASKSGPHGANTMVNRPELAESKPMLAEIGPTNRPNSAEPGPNLAEIRQTSAESPKFGRIWHHGSKLDKWSDPAQIWPKSDQTPANQWPKSGQSRQASPKLVSKADQFWPKQIWEQIQPTNGRNQANFGTNMIEQVWPKPAKLKTNTRSF